MPPKAFAQYYREQRRKTRKAMSSYWAQKRLHTAAESYYNDQQYSDFSITCEGVEFKVHRCFIAPHSRFFEKACGGMFRETQERKIDLKDDDPSLVEMMIKYFYTFTYDETPPRAETSSLGLHARIYTIADKYEVLDLKAIALENFEHAVSSSCKNGKVMVEGARALTECNPPPTCDTTLHDLMIEAWLHGGEELFADVGEAELDSFLTEVPWLAAAFATRLFKGFMSEPLQVDCIGGYGCRGEGTDSQTVMSGVHLRCSLCHPWMDDARVEVFKLSYAETKQIWSDLS